MWQRFAKPLPQYSHPNDEPAESVKTYMPTTPSQAAKPKPITRVACGGGGAKGVLYPGAYRALRKAGMLDKVEHFSGVSAGAITATFMALGMKETALNEKLIDTDFKGLMGKSVNGLVTKDGNNLRDFVKDSIIETLDVQLKALENQIKELSPEKKEKVQNIIDKVNAAKANEIDPEPILFKDIGLLNDLFSDKVKKLTMTAIRLPNGELQVFDSTETPDVEVALAVRASASLPILLTPPTISINGKAHQYIDGGIYDNLPTNYFDPQKNGVYENIKKEETLVFAFGEGRDNTKNPIHQAIHGNTPYVEGEKKAPVLYDANLKERIKRDVSVTVYGRMISLPFRNTTQKEISFQKIRKDYPNRTVELRTGDISTTDFELAKKRAPVMESIGFLDSMNHAIDENLYDSDKLNADEFYQTISQDFQENYIELLKNEGESITENPLLKIIKSIKSEPLAPSDENKKTKTEQRKIVDAIKAYVEQNPESLAAQTLPSATKGDKPQVEVEVELYQAANTRPSIEPVVSDKKTSSSETIDSVVTQGLENLIDQVNEASEKYKDSPQTKAIVDAFKKDLVKTLKNATTTVDMLSKVKNNFEKHAKSLSQVIELPMYQKFWNMIVDRTPLSDSRKYKVESFLGHQEISAIKQQAVSMGVEYSSEPEAPSIFPRQ